MLKPMGAVLLLIALLLTGCNNGGEDAESDFADSSAGSTVEQLQNGTETETPSDFNDPNANKDSNTVQTPDSDPSDSEKKLTIVSNKASEYVLIRPRSISSTMQQTILDFTDDLKKKTGVDLSNSMYADSVNGKKKEILIGAVQGRSESAEVLQSLSYSGYAVRVVGEKIIVSAYSDNLLEEALNKLLVAIQKEENGDFTISASYALTAEASGASVPLPLYNTVSGILEGVYYCGNENYEVSFKETNQSEYERYLNALESKGFTEYTTNAIGSNLFATYVSDEGDGTAVYTMFYPNSATCKIVYGARNYLPGTEEMPAPTGSAIKTTPSITQFGVEVMYKINSAPGMNYVIQLADGRFILIDGGPADGSVQLMKKEPNGTWVEDGEPKESQDAKNLYDFLCDRNPNGGKPVIAAWIITHAHGDHIGLATSFLSTYKNDVTLEMVAYNFPDFDSISIANESATTMGSLARRFEAVVKNYHRTAKTFIFHTGQKLYFPGCNIEFFYTHEDFFPNTIPWGNHTSAAFRITLNDTTFMVLGDCEVSLNQQMAETYGSVLKSDIMQIVHHGANGAYLELYQLIDPEICLWPCSTWAFETNPQQLGTQSGYGFNAWIRDNTVKQRTHYLGDVTTTIPC